MRSFFRNKIVQAFIFTLVIIVSSVITPHTEVNAVGEVETLEAQVLSTSQVTLKGILLLDQPDWPAPIKKVGFVAGTSEQEVLLAECGNFVTGDWIAPSGIVYPNVTFKKTFSFANSEPGSQRFFKACAVSEPDGNGQVFNFDGNVNSFVFLTEEQANAELTTITNPFDENTIHNGYATITSRVTQAGIGSTGFAIGESENALGTCVYVRENEFHVEDSTTSYQIEVQNNKTIYYQSCVKNNLGVESRKNVEQFTFIDSTNGNNCRIDYIEFLPGNKATISKNSAEFNNFLLDKGRHMTIRIYAKDATECVGTSVRNVWITDIRSYNNQSAPPILTPYRTNLHGTFNESGIITFNNIVAGSAIDNGTLDTVGYCFKGETCEFGIQLDYSMESNPPRRFKSWIDHNPGGFYDADFPNTEEKRNKGIVWFKSIDGTRFWQHGCRFEPGDIYFENFSGTIVPNQVVRLNVNTKYCKGIPITLEIYEEDSSALSDVLLGSLNAAAVAAKDEIVWTVVPSAAYSLLTTGAITAGVTTISATGVGAVAVGAVAAYVAATTIDDRVDISFQDIENEQVQLYAPETDILYFDLRTTDDECDEMEDEGEPDCVLYASITTPPGLDNNSSVLLPLYREDGNWQTQRNFTERGLLVGECDPEEGCYEDTLGDLIGAEPWVLLQTNGLVNQDDPEGVFTQYTDSESPCYQDNGTYDENCYELLAPVPGLGEDVKGNGRFAIRDLNNYQLGKYLNTIFQVVLGILIVIAVVMIIVAGVQYMTVESFYGKSDAKKRITGAITGLILALAIFIILNTINPRLLEINFGKDIEKVSIGTGVNSTYIQTDTSVYSESDFINQKGLPKKPSCSVVNYTKQASAELGVPQEHILSIIAQESNFGGNVGDCTILPVDDGSGKKGSQVYPNVMRQGNGSNNGSERQDVTAFKEIISNLGREVYNEKVSCPIGSNPVENGYGGGMGPAQFIPTTWKNVMGINGNDPQKMEDAIVAATTLIKTNGGATDIKNAACKYYSGKACDPNKVPENEFYGNQVLIRSNLIKNELSDWNNSCT
ncbi:lytic murein transglycosylase [Patescibacteria group bacterium]|nr:lytic murein transglycosylase [Patescibacteria group bacterium]